MQIIPVTTPALEKEWFHVDRVIYKGDPNWVPFIVQEIQKIFDPRKNKLLRSGEAMRWILRDEKGRSAGRIAAFVNPQYSKEFKNVDGVGGVGFFECINNKEAAHLLFDTAREWLLSKGMQAMDGPINLGEKLNYWGCIIENFDAPATFGMNYNPSYYPELFESYGFNVYYEQHVFHRSLLDPAQEVFVRKAEMLKLDPEIRVSNIRGWNDDMFARNFMEVYNDAWGGHDGFKPLTYEAAMKTYKGLKQVYDPDIVIFVFKKDRPIGFYVNLPELNQVFKYVGGNMNLLGKIKYILNRKLRHPKTMYGIIFGVVKDYQGRGVEGAMIKYAETDLAPLGRYTDTILNWIGDFNPKMLHVCENLGAKLWRRYATYRYYFDRERPFERAPIIGVKARKEGTRQD